MAPGAACAGCPETFESQARNLIGTSNESHASANAAPRPGFRWSFVAAGFAALLASAHYDIIRSPLLPKVLRELHLEFGDGGWFYAASNAAATVATGLMIGALNRWTERAITLVIAVICLAGAAWATAVTDFAGLIVLALTTGGAVSGLGALANVLVIEGTPAHRQGRMLAGLHSVYGLGSMSAASIVGLAMTRGVAWSSLYLVGTPLLALLVAIAVWAMGGRHLRRNARVEPVALTGLQILAVVLFAVYVVGEVTASMWLPSYLVAVTHISEAAGAVALTRYFGVLTATRILCFLFITPAREKPVLLAALAIPIAAFAIGYGGHPAAFPAMGVFGAFFPVYLARISRRFQAQWRSVTVWAMTAVNVFVGLAELGLGQLADRAGLKIAFLIPPSILCLTLVLLIIYFKKEEAPA